MTSIDVVVVQSEIHVDIVALPGTEAVASLTMAPGERSSRLLASYRCRPGVTRVQLKIRTIEGEHGSGFRFTPVFF